MYFIFYMNSLDEVNYSQFYFEIETAKEKGYTVLYWNENKRFFSDFNLDDFNETNNFLFRGPVEGYLNFCTVYGCLYNIDTIKRWAFKFPYSICKRNFVLGEYSEDSIASVVDQNDRFFIKSFYKDFSFAGTLTEWRSKKDKFISSSSHLYLYSEYRDLKTDNYGVEEYRGIYINGSIVDITRQVLYNNIQVSDDVKMFYEQIRRYIKENNLYQYCCIDVVRLKDNELMLEELNNVETCGFFKEDMFSKIIDKL